jgi:hypothetical protein
VKAVPLLPELAAELVEGRRDSMSARCAKFDRQIEGLDVNQLRRGLFLLSLLAVIWAVMVALTGGVFLWIGPLRVSSTNPRRVLGVAAAAALALGMLSLSPTGRRALQQELLWLRGLVLASWALFRRYSRFARIVPALVIVVISVSADVRHWASAVPLWLDEEMIALNIRDRSFSDLAGPLWLGQSAPYGWLAIERTAVLTLGDSERSLRVAPLLFGVATLATALVVGARWLSAAGAALFVGLCAFAPWFGHFRYEVKHYSADIFWALLLPAVAVWTIEAPDARARTRRCAIWCGLAAIGLWFANGALFVTPACGLFMFAALWRRDGVRAAVRAGSLGLVWLISFGAYYQVSVRHTLASSFLWSYWANELPSSTLGFSGTLDWLVNRLQPLAINPGGATTTSWVGFWGAAVCGLAFGSKHALRAAFAAVAVSPFVLAAAGFVPLFERFSIWGVPALYLGITLLVDRMLRVGWAAVQSRQWLTLTVAFMIAAAACLVCAEIVRRGWGYVIARTTDDNHGFDDRAAVQWLMEQRQPGDAIATTRLAWPAVWWYGRLPVAQQDVTDGRLATATTMYEVFHLSGPECRSMSIREILRDHTRVLVHLGFQDFPPGFDEVTLRRFGESGAVRGYREFAIYSRAAIIDLREPPSGAPSPIAIRSAGELPPLAGCVGLRPMHLQ